jgi:NAD+ synthetase
METINWAKVAKNLRTEIKLYLEESNLQSVVLGISGGIDSALVATLFRPVCTALSIPLIMRSISIETNKPDEKERARNMGLSFADDFREIDLTELYHITRDTIEENPEEDKSAKAYKLRVGNIKVRLRMVYLYNLAQQKKGMVLNTDNYTEYMLGFWTLHGDVGDFNPLFSLWKTEVYALARHLLSELNPQQKSALQACIDGVPTDGLGISSSDVEQFGAQHYEEVDHTLQHYLQDPLNTKKYTLNESVIQRHHASVFKRNNPYNVPRKIAFKDAEPE